MTEEFNLFTILRTYHAGKTKQYKVIFDGRVAMTPEEVEFLPTVARSFSDIERVRDSICIVSPIAGEVAVEGRKSWYNMHHSFDMDITDWHLALIKKYVEKIPKDENVRNSTTTIREIYDSMKEFLDSL